MAATAKERILEAALEVLGQHPDAGMGEIATAAGVVRRTVYGSFPTRADLVRALTERAVGEIEGVLAEVDADGPADAAWADFVARLWPVVGRYRVLVVLRRSEYGDEIHALLGPVDTTLARMIARGQAAGVFGRHLPAELLGRIAWSTVFSVAADPVAGVRAATIASLLLLGVGASRAEALADRAAA